MLLRLSLFTLLILSSYAQSFGQKKTVVVIIDTLVGNDWRFEFSYIAVQDYSLDTNGKLVAAPFSDSTVSLLPDFKSPHIVKPIKISSASDLLLPLDSKGSRFTIKNIDRLDTLHIAKWEILKNDLPDTTLTSIFYSRKLNDSTGWKTYKSKSRKHYGGSKKKAHSTINIVVNGSGYSVPLSVERRSVLTTGHGYKPLRRYNRYIKYLIKYGQEKKRRNFSKLNFHSIHTSYEYSGQLEL